MGWRVNGVRLYEVKGKKQKGKGRKRKTFRTKKAAKDYLERRGRK